GPATAAGRPSARGGGGRGEGGGLVRAEFLEARADRPGCNPGRHRARRNPAVTRGERLRCRDQTTTPFVEERRHRRKPLSDGFDIDHHHNIWYDITVVNPYFTLSKVDSIIFGRVLREQSHVILVMMF